MEQTYEETVEKLSQLQRTLIAMNEASFRKDVVLVRLCFGGMKLKDAVNAKVDELIGIGEEAEAKAKLIGYINTDYALKDFGPFYLMVIDYCTSLRSTRSMSEKLEQSRPAFASRKKGQPITPRTAERCLAELLTKLGQPNSWTFRSIRHLGKQSRFHKTKLLSLVQLELAYSIQTAGIASERFLYLKTRLTPYFKKRFQDASDVDDAVQETLFRLAKAHRDQHCIGSDLAFALGIARNVFKEYLRSRIGADISNLQAFFMNSTTREEIESPKSRSYQDSKYATNAVNRLKSILSSMERHVIDRMFSHEPLTMAEIGKEIGISSGYVSRLRDNAMKKLRVAINSNLNGEFHHLFDLLS